MANMGDEAGASASKSLIICQIDSDAVDNLCKMTTIATKGRKSVTRAGLPAADVGVARCDGNDDNGMEAAFPGAGQCGESGRRGRENEETQDANNKKRRINHVEVGYSKEHTGEIYVLVDTSEAEKEKIKRVRNGLYLVEKMKGIKEEEFDKIKRIDAIGVTLYKLTFCDIGAANKFVCNEELKERKLRAFFPAILLKPMALLEMCH